MFRIGLILIAIVAAVNGYTQESDIVFNKTEYDFGDIAPSAIPFEKDFVFRNTSESIVHILTVRSVSPALSFIHTRSEILPTEYGFVKAKLKAADLDGLFHDEVYVTFKIGDDVLSEVIYLRAQVSNDGIATDDRAFQDSEIAISVEVSPEDIETMEGFMGSDQLARAESEIDYLKKQVAIKSELIVKLSDDLRLKQQKEAENIERLSAIENSLKTSNAEVDENVKAQLEELAARLNKMQQSGDSIQDAISYQESQFNALKRQSDSARAHAEQLSQQLAEQFKAQMDAMNLASKLEKDLLNKEAQEKRQQAQIDSLQRSLENGDSKTSSEIEKLKTELAWKLKEQKIQEAHAEFQNEKIARLNETQEMLAEKSDSLERSLENRSEENARLKSQLAQTDDRIGIYEQRIDSLVKANQNIQPNPEQEKELTELKQQLAQLEQRDENLKLAIAKKDSELNQLELERAKTQKNLDALELATSRQLEETHNLMYRVNKISKKEGEARREIEGLQAELESSRYREKVARTSVKTLEREIDQREANIQLYTDSLSIQDAELASLTKEQARLEKQLNNAKLSNTLAFEEIKSEAAAIQSERDSLLEINTQLRAKNQKLSDHLNATEQQKVQAEMVIAEIENGNKGHIYYSISVLHTKDPLTPLPNQLGNSISIHQSDKGYEYIVGHYSTMKQAQIKSDKLRTSGYKRAHVIAFKDGTRISMSDALETAEKF